MERKIHLTVDNYNIWLTVDDEDVCDGVLVSEKEEAILPLPYIPRVMLRMVAEALIKISDEKTGEK